MSHNIFFAAQLIKYTQRISPVRVQDFISVRKNWGIWPAKKAQEYTLHYKIRNKKGAYITKI